MPRSRKRNPSKEAEVQRPIPPLFRQRLMAALEGAPKVSGAGFSPAQGRPMSRQKIAAAYLHCLKLSLKEIAKGASGVICSMGTRPPGEKRPLKSASYGMLGGWRSELEFNALVERAKAEMIGALKGAYDSIEDAEEFGYFVNELMGYQLDIIFALVKYAETVAESTRERLAHIRADLLFLRWARACGGVLGRQSHLWARELSPLLELVEVASVQFAKAEAHGDWQLAREAFDSVEVLAKLHAAQVDARAQRAASVETGRLSKKLHRPHPHL
jgi:hypothetical protein